MESIFWKRSPPAKRRLFSFFFFLAFLISAESTSLFLLFHPRLIPRPLLSAFKNYYDNYHRDILQYNKNISHYSPALFYQMKSNNRSLFTNIEFSDSIFTDNLAFRDNHPTTRPAEVKVKVICLGDSYTLGWGLQQEETYPARLEEILKRPVLNTGMSSYGTAREVTSTQSLDMTGVSTVIIQYCFNDADENASYANDHDQLSISPASVYDSAVNTLYWSKVYFPGKCFCTLSKLILTEKIALIAGKKQQDSPIGYDNEAGRFLEVLKKSGFDFSKIHLFVFDIREYQNLTGRFVQSLEKQMTLGDNSRFFQGHLHILHIENLFTPADYYILDEHVRPSGALKIAAFIADAIRHVQP